MTKKNKTVGAGVGVIIKNKGKILLIKRQGSHGAGTWAPAGGHIDFGETVEETAKREVKEEIGIRIKNLNIVGLTNDIFKKDKKHYITIWIVSDLKSGTPKMKNGEMSEIGWFKWNQLPKPLFIPLKNFLDGKLFPN